MKDVIHCNILPVCTIKYVRRGAEVVKAILNQVEQQDAD